MAEIDNIIQVQISRETQSIATASFQIPLVLTEHTVFAERSRVYTDIQAVEADFLPGSSTYEMALRLFGQQGVRPPAIVVGRKAADPETYADALIAVEQENNDWYGLTCESHLDADILALAALIEARKKIYITSTQSPDAILAPTTDIIGQLNALGYFRTAIVYLPTADAEFPECAWVGSQLPRTPGSNDWDFKTATGITVSLLTDTDRANLRAKDGNMYTSVGGVSIFQDGNMVNGSYIDEQILVDWIVARMQEAIYFRLVNNLKIPYTREGFTIIENEMRGVLSQGVANGGLANNPAPVVRSPDPLAIPVTQRVQRIAGDFEFEARFAGAVRVVLIQGVLTV